MKLRTFAMAGAIALTSTAALAGGHTAGCPTDGRVSIVGNEFPAIQTVGAGAVACAGDSVEVTTNLTADHQTINLPGMSGNPAEYTSAIIANSSIVALINEDVIRPLDDLVAEYGQNLQKNQLITIGGEVMAVAFMANAQHLVYREDILAEAGIEVPTTYEEMLAAAETLRSSGAVQNPIGGPYAAGWNLAQEFNNMFLGYGGQFFEAGTANPTVNSEAGVKALEMMKALSAYMNPDFLTHDSNATSAEWKAGNVAMMHMWGSRVGPLRDTADGGLAEVADNTAIAGPLTVGGGDIPASTLWWDGFTVAKNISDEDAAATFQALLKAIDPSILNEEVSQQAVWLINGYEPTAAATGVFAAANSGTIPYPMLPFMGLMHTALGAELSDFMQGNESAEDALADVEAAYIAAAKEKGFL